MQLSVENVKNNDCSDVHLVLFDGKLRYTNWQEENHNIVFSIFMRQKVTYLKYLQSAGNVLY